MRNGRVDVGSTRREQVVEAAVAVIAERGIQKLSLSAIEKRTGMARGHLTYYFRTKEDILLAVFDHTVETMRRRVGVPECDEFERSGWAGAQHLLRMLLLGPLDPVFGPLMHTFLAQLSHREDFRQRIAGLYEEWRSNMTRALEMDLANVAEPPPFPPRALATLIQAVLHGMVVQRAADPDAFDREQVLELCLDVLGPYFRLRPAKPRGRPRSKKRSKDRPTGK